jgi:hypothetical protein
MKTCFTAERARQRRDKFEKRKERQQRKIEHSRHLHLCEKLDALLMREQIDGRCDNVDVVLLGERARTTGSQSGSGARFDVGLLAA